jgi:hypothetical protein
VQPVPGTPILDRTARNPRLKREPDGLSYAGTIVSKQLWKSPLTGGPVAAPIVPA